MSRLTDLLRAAKQLDPELGKDLEEEIVPLQKRLPFGLNFERHAPEAVELAGHAIRKGSKVRVLPPRGSTERGDQRLWRVSSIAGEVAQVSLLDAAEDERREVAMADLVLVAEFRDRIYPGLRPDGTVEHGGDKPFHTVINGENFHVLEQLTFTHEHSVDAIYIDPPYNSGARDWRYNNDYVEDDDLYRHSKWLAFMERRLKLAKRLLKPDDSVLIVTIDEKEYLRLGLLLGQIFPEATVDMVTSIVNPRGRYRPGGFARSDEYLYFVRIGAARVGTEDDPDYSEGEGVPWRTLRRSDAASARGSSKGGPAQFYPIYVTADGRIAEIGEALPHGVSRESAPSRPGCTPVFPIRESGLEMNWGLTAAALREIHKHGYVRVGRHTPSKPQMFEISYLTSGKIDDIVSGRASVTGRNPDGSVIATYATNKKKAPTTTWARPSHNAETSGTAIVNALLPGRSFPFPKALYAVEDALRLFVGDKADAVILDFFSGSGTTAHAVMRLNKQDGGRRQCILVTNNEVSADDQSKLRKEGLRPGDPEWEKWGICDFITKPRIRAAITGRTSDGVPIKGDYKFTDEFPMADGFDENAAFFTLMYESPWRVSTDRAFSAIAPMLWLRAGAQGPQIHEIADGWAVAETYGIINDLDRSAEFIAALNDAPAIRIAYIVTDDEGRYQQVANEIRGIETVRLYEDYLRNCESTGDF
ncbi:site-specific DNA-methyltransferase [Agromyces sp. SYSU T00266]|uniref:site-specific DNA-methyltransferase n=1 Tax=Agromyces zhanjiangensis TaxID=3158562 RepID=UPI003391F2CF